MRLIFILLLFISIFVSALTRPVPAQAAGCVFVQGFKTLQDMIPNVVGDCLVNQHYSPSSGDALQETTHGLLVWRKADNWTAFTDGYRTWINGPYGLQQRLNGERLPWESTTPSCEMPTSAVEIQRYARARNGMVTAEGLVRNPCDRPINAMVNVVAQRADGTPIVDSSTIFVQSIPPGGSRDFIAYVPISGQWDGVHFQAQLSWFADRPPGDFCADVGTATCLKVDPWLLDVVDALRALDEGRWLLEVAAEHGVRIVRARTDAGVLATYDQAKKVIVLDGHLDDYSAWVRAAILAHELQHAADDAAGKLNESEDACLRTEEAASRRESQVWTDLWQNHLPPDVDSLHAMENGITSALAKDPEGFARMLRQTYGHGCNSKAAH